MKKKLVLITAIVLLAGLFNLKAQNTITTIKGDIFNTSEYKILEENDYKEIKYLNENGKYRYLEFEDVYAIETEEKKSVVYQPRDEFDLTKTQMKHLVNGRIAGKDAGSFWGPFLFTFAATTSTGFLDQGDIFAAPLVPLGTTISIGLYGWLSKPKISSEKEYYVTGYKEQKTFRMIKASLLGGGAGLLTAATIHGIRHY